MSASMWDRLPESMPLSCTPPYTRGGGKTGQRGNQACIRAPRLVEPGLAWPLTALPRDTRIGMRGHKPPQDLCRELMH